MNSYGVIRNSYGVIRNSYGVMMNSNGVIMNSHGAMMKSNGVMVDSHGTHITLRGGVLECWERSAKSFHIGSASLIKNSPPLQDNYRTLGIVLL